MDMMQSAIEQQRKFVEDNRTLDRTIGERDKLNDFIHKENPRHDDERQDDQAGVVEGEDSQPLVSNETGS